MSSVGIIGCGVISATHLRAWRSIKQFQVRGVFDLDRNLAAKRASEFQIPRVYESIHDLLAACDVVDVCTPPQTHRDIACQVIREGKHLLIEKPIVTNLADWEQLAGLMATSPSKISVVHNLKYIRGVLRAKRWVEQGHIGEIIGLHREFLTSPATDRMLVGNTHWSKRLPGGRWFETLPHELYLIHSFVGPLQLSHVTALHTPKAPSGAPADEVLIAMENAQCLATIRYSAHSELNRRTLTLFGTRGMITIDVLSDLALLSTVPDKTWTRGVGRPLIEAVTSLLQGIPEQVGKTFARARDETPHAKFIRAFARQIEGNGPNPSPLPEIEYVVRTADWIGREIDRQVSQATPRDAAN